MTRRGPWAFLLAVCGFLLSSSGAIAQDYAFGGRGGVFGSQYSGIGKSFLSLPIVVVNPTNDVSGLGAGERIVTIDQRPSNGVLYAITLHAQLDQLKLYELNPATGGAVIKFGPFPVINDPDTLGGGAINGNTDAFRVVLSNGYHGVYNFDGTKSDLPTPFFPPGDPNAGKTPRLHNLAFIDSFFAFDSGTGSVVQGPSPTGELTTIKKITSAPNDRVIGFDAISPTTFRLIEKNFFGITTIDINPPVTITNRTFRFLALPRFPEGLHSFSNLSPTD